MALHGTALFEEQHEVSSDVSAETICNWNSESMDVDLAVQGLIGN